MLFEDQEFALCHILNRHVPAMSQGFVIRTNYGEMRVEGAEAQKVKAIIEKATLAKLKKLRARQAKQG